MDQLNQILGMLRKHYFWLLVCVAAGAGLLVWFLGSQKVVADYEERVGELESLRSQVSQIGPGAPNQEVVNATEAKIEELRQEVFSAWNFLYNNQKEQNQWPASLSPEFHRMIEAKEFGDTIEFSYRQEYMNFITEHFPTLFNIIDYRHPEGADLTELFSLRGQATGMGSGSSYGGYSGYSSTGTGYPGSMSEDGYAGYGSGSSGRSGTAGRGMVGTVEWDQGSIGLLKGRFAWQNVPNSKQIWEAQEDLWVYEALLRVIRKTNEGASGFHNASVKRIQVLEIGSDAASSLAGSRGGAPGSSYGYGSSSEYGSSMSYPTGGSPSGDVSATPSGSTTSSSGSSSSAEGYGYGSYGSGMQSQSLGRYVDAEGNPLTPDQESPFAEFKMMPVHMLLIMDQREIDTLLVNAANSSMPVRVTRVAIRPERSATVNLRPATGGSAYPGSSSGSEGYPTGGYPDSGYDSYGSGSTGYGSGSSYGSTGEGYGSSAYGGGSSYGSSGSQGISNRLGEEYTPYDLRVDIRGVIYIFNRPDPEKLGTGTGAEGIEVAPEVPMGPLGLPSEPVPPPAAPEDGTQPPAPTAPGPGPQPPAGPNAAGVGQGNGAAPPAGSAPSGTPATPPAGAPAAPPVGPPPAGAGANQNNQ